METKEELVTHIKEWINVDEELKTLQKEIKLKRLQKKTLTASLVDVMKSNDLDCFDLNSGTLVYTKNKVKSTLSKKVLLNALKEYYGDQSEEIDKLSSHILNSRGESIKEGIVQREIIVTNGIDGEEEKKEAGSWGNQYCDKYVAAEYARARVAAKKIDGDVIYASKPFFTSLVLGILIKILRRKPLVLDIDDCVNSVNFSHRNSRSLDISC